MRKRLIDYPFYIQFFGVPIAIVIAIVKVLLTGALFVIVKCNEYMDTLETEEDHRERDGKRKIDKWLNEKKKVEL